MSFAIAHRFPGGTQQQYEATVAALHGPDGALPEGQILHVAGAVPDGWAVYAIHDSKASWEKFRDTILVPRMQAGIEGGFTTPPVETEVDVFTIQQSPELAKALA